MLALPAYPLKNARHHWAVRMLRGGAPVRVVQAQLGHSTATLTLDTYGRWMPASDDRAGQRPGWRLQRALRPIVGPTKWQRNRAGS